MKRIVPKQAFAAREAHEALIELKNLVDEAAKTTRTAELESFHVAVSQGENAGVRDTLRQVADRLTSTQFDAMLSQIREKLQTAVSA